jgi:hypothetical protein
MMEDEEKGAEAKDRRDSQIGELIDGERGVTVWE